MELHSVLEPEASGEREEATRTIAALVTRFFDIMLRSSRELDLKALRKEVQNSSSNVQRYLNLGWIGVCEVLNECNRDMSDLIDLWQDFHSFLLRLQYLLFKLEKILTLRERVLYFLLYFSFSKFPNRLRPPCTTMPWTIWPALMVLWGVCWMFYEELNWNWGDQGDLPMASNTTGPFDDVDSIDPSLGDCASSFLSKEALNFLPVFDSNLSDISCDMSMWSESHFDLPNLEQRLQLCVPGPATTCGTAIPLSTIPTSSVVRTGDTNLPITSHGNPSGIVTAPRFTSCRATSKIQEAAENERLEATESGALIPLNTFLVQGQARDDQTVSSRNSRHGQTEKYFCAYSDCSRSQPGSGFYRKDHLDQHLRGLHKQNSVPRLRAKPVAASSACNPTTTSETTGALFQSKKRKRGSGGETGRHSGDELFDELAEERRLRLLVEQENQRLRQKIENYEGRMQKYEERLDKMMTLIEEHKVEGKR